MHCYYTDYQTQTARHCIYTTIDKNPYFSLRHSLLISEPANMAERVRDLDKAKSAYESQDVEMTIAAHNQRSEEDGETIQHGKERHSSGGGGYLKSIVFGALDGIVTTFATIAGVAGADYGINVVVTLGFSALLADAISMGLGDYLSSAAELDWTKKERRREAWEFEHVRAAEIEEMVEIYVEKGFDRDDAETILNLMAKQDEFFIDHMMVQELGMMPPDPSDSPAKSGAVMFASFLFVGAIPLLAYLVFFEIPWDPSFRTYGTFILAAVITAIALFFLGFVKGRLIGSKSIQSGLWVMLNGAIASGAAFGVAYGFSFAVPDECKAELAQLQADCTCP